MNLINQLNQNPLVAIIVIIVSVIGVVWKVFHALYVKPRDFKITDLIEKTNTLENELVRLRREQDRQITQPFVQIPDKTRVTPRAKRAEEVASVARMTTFGQSPLSSLATCYAQWSDDSLTKLQKQKFEKDFTGKQVSWKVQVDSVSEAENGSIYLYVKETTEGRDRPRACALFQESEQNALLPLGKGESIVLKGIISEFFLWPILRQCEIENVE